LEVVLEECAESGLDLIGPLLAELLLPPEESVLIIRHAHGQRPHG
jgi:hypothetical protein